MSLLRNIMIWMALWVALTLDLHVKSCPENEFMIQGSICCHICPEGRYRAVNCTKNANGFVESGTCVPCTKCANSTAMIAPCTHFADTRCTMIEINTTTNNPKTGVMPPTLTKLVMALYATVTVVFVVIIAALVNKWCTRRNVSHDPARDPIKIMI